MPELALTLPMFEAAKENGFAIPALNANGNIITDAAIEAAELENSPLILQASQGAIRHAGSCPEDKGANPAQVMQNLDRGTQVIVAMTRALLANRRQAVVGLNLDHGSDVLQNALCFRHGFTMLMYDGSKEPLNINIANSRQIVQMARAVPGIAVEAEIGRIGALKDSDEPGVAINQMKQHWTKPEELAALAVESGADLFATAVGQIHGCRDAVAQLDFDLFSRCIKAVEQALGNKRFFGFVLHGASGVKDVDVSRAIDEFGVVKINVDTKLRQAYMKAFLGYQTAHPGNIDQRRPERAGHDAVVEVCRKLIKLFNSSGKAPLAQY